MTIQVKRNGQRASRIVTIETPVFAPAAVKATVTARKRRMSQRFAGHIESGMAALRVLAMTLHQKGFTAADARHVPSGTIHL